MSDQAKSKRDDLRAATLGQTRKFISRKVKYNGQEFEIRQPTIKARAALRKQSSVYRVDGTVDFDLFEFIVQAVIANTFIPGTDERVFEPNDYEALVANPPGGFIDEFGAIATELMNVDSDEAKKG